MVPGGNRKTDDGVLFTTHNITDRKQQERNQLFLSEISKQLVENTSMQVNSIAPFAEKIAMHYGATWCMFAEVANDPEASVNSYGWNAANVASVKGKYRVRDFLSDELLQKITAGEISVVNDVRTNPHVNGSSYEAIGIRSFITVPEIHNGHWKLLFSIIHNEPRKWRNDEIELAVELCKRISARVEKARAEEALQKSEKLKSFLLKLSDVLHPLADPVQIKKAGVNILGNELAVSRCYYTEVDADDTYCIIENGFYKGATSLDGKYKIEDYGKGWLNKIGTGNALVVNDVKTDRDITIIEQEALLALEIGSYITQPLFKSNRIAALLSVSETGPRSWSDFDMLLIKETAERIWAAMEKATIEKALQNSEEQFRTLFDSVDEGFTIVKAFYDNEGRIDLLYEAINPAYTRIMGIGPEIIGRTAREIFSVIEEDLFEKSKRVGFDGETINAELFLGAINRWIETNWTPVSIPGTGRFSVLFKDITERKLAEQRHLYLLRLSDALRTLSKPNEIRFAAMQLMGSHFEVNRAAYVDAETEPDRMRVISDYTQDVEPWVGTINLADFGAALGKDFAEGKTVAITDVQSDKRFADSRHVYASLEIGAAVGVPLYKNGRVVAAMGVHNKTPRNWRPDEIMLIEETAERTWAAVERAKAEEALRKSEEKYRAIFNSISEGFSLLEILFDESGNAYDVIIRDANPAQNLIDGVQALIGKRLSEILPHIKVKWIERYAAVVKNGEPVNFEDWSEVNQKWYKVQASRVGGNGSTLVAIIYDDITEQKNIKERQAYLLKLNDALRSTTDPVQIQIVSANFLGEYLKVNQSHYGEAVGDYINIHHSYVNGVLPMTGNIHYEDFGKRLGVLFREGKTQVCYDTTTDPAISADEKKVFALAHIGAYIAIPLIKNNEWVAIMAVHNSKPRQWKQTEIFLMHEMAERTWAAVERARSDADLEASEKKLQLFTQELEKTVHQRTGQIEQQNTQLQKVNKELEAFNYMASHDLQEPLRKIQTYTSLLIRSDEQTMSDNGKKYLSRVLDASSRMRILIRDLLSFSRLSTSENEFETADLQQIVIELESEFKETIEEKNVIIEAPGSCEINIIPFQFRQLLHNLISNSLKFSRPAVSPVIKISCEFINENNEHYPLGASKACHIVYTDNGIGFEPEFSQKIFDLFQQLHSKDEYPGTGIGLAIVKKVVDNHKGIITASGELGRFARFDIYLPC